MKLYIRLLLFVISVIFLVYGFIKNDLDNKKLFNKDTIFVLDVSNSMNVEDVFYNGHKVSRLKLAKKLIENNVNNYDKAFGLILFSDKIDYFIPPTLDKKTFIEYLKTINTNNLDGGKSDFVKSINELNNVLNPTDIVVLLSDFDFTQNIKDIKIKNYVYLVGIGTNQDGVVKNKEGNLQYYNGKLLKSSLGKTNIKELSSYLSSDYKIINDYKKTDKVIGFLDKNNNITFEDKKNINYLDIFWSAVLILIL